MNRRNSTIRYATVIVLDLCGLVFSQSVGDKILGPWYTEKCQAIFDFHQNGNEYRAKMIALEKPGMIDAHNPIDSLRTRKVSGIIAVYGLVYYAEKQQWVNGKVYNPEDGRTYSCYCSLRDGGTRMYFRGYIGVSVLGGSQVWTRAGCGEK